MSIICAPPMIVRISDACPGQSTSVNCTLSYGVPLDNVVIRVEVVLKVMVHVSQSYRTQGEAGDRQEKR